MPTITAKITKEDHELIKRAVKIKECTRAFFIRNAAVVAAKKLLKENGDYSG